MAIFLFFLLLRLRLRLRLCRLCNLQSLKVFGDVCMPRASLSFLYNAFPNSQFLCE